MWARTPRVLRRVVGAAGVIRPAAARRGSRAQGAGVSSGGRRRDRYRPIHRRSRIRPRSAADLIAPAVTYSAASEFAIPRSNARSPLSFGSGGCERCFVRVYLRLTCCRRARDSGRDLGSACRRGGTHRTRISTPEGIAPWSRSRSIRRGGSFEVPGRTPGRAFTSSRPWSPVSRGPAAASACTRRSASGRRRALGRLEAEDRPCVRPATSGPPSPGRCSSPIRKGHRCRCPCGLS